MIDVETAVIVLKLALDRENNIAETSALEYAIGVLEELERRIESNRISILWTENNFIPGPNTKAAIGQYEYAIKELKAVRDGDPDD